MACTSTLTKNFVENCTHSPKSGIVSKFIVNIADIDKSSSQVSADGTVVTALVLETGAKVYEVEGDERTNMGSFEFTSDEISEGYIHKDGIRIKYRGKEQRSRVKEMLRGRFATILQKVDIGDSGEIEYEISGYESGMHVVAHSADFTANKGTATLEMQTKDGELESTEPKVWEEVGGIDTWLTTNTYVPA